MQQKKEEKPNQPTKEILDLTKQLVELDAKYEEASKLKAKLYNQKTQLIGELYEKMTELGLENFRSSKYGLISTYNKLWARVVNLDLASEWFKEQGIYDEVLKLEPVNSRLNQIVEERLEKGEAMPPGVDFSMKRSISIRSA